MSHDHAHDDHDHRRHAGPSLLGATPSEARAPRHHDHDGPPGPHRHDQHQHNHEHDDGHGEHDHEHEDSGLLGHLPFFHSHSHGSPTVDPAMEASTEGLRTLALSLAGLAVTAIIQFSIAIASGSAGLLADTIHNATDALTALPLGLAFLVGRRPPTRRYPYGYGRAEDLAGVLIVVLIAASAVLAGYESVQKLLHPVPLTHLWWVVGAALVGCLGNEAVAELRIRTGQRIGSAALVADGQHARVDGLTSLAVLVGALLSAAGLHLADPVVGLLITVAILFIVRDSAQTMWYRLMDAVDPALLTQIERVAAATPGVQAVSEARARHLGHRVFADVCILVEGDLTTARGHVIAEEVHHALLHRVPRLAEAHVHVDPAGVPEAHALTEAHTQRGVAPHAR
jgi:cation diffusion facilitator family transporter